MYKLAFVIRNLLADRFLEPSSWYGKVSETKIRSKNIKRNSDTWKLWI